MDRMENDFFKSVAALCEQIAGMADDSLPYLSTFTDDVADSNRVLMDRVAK